MVLRLLIADFYRRRWPLLLLGVSGFSFIWAGAALFADPTEGPIEQVYGYSMSAAFFLGFLCNLPYPAALLVDRVVAYLPVSRRDTWRAVWIIGMVGGPAITSLIKVVTLVAVPRDTTIGPAGIALSTLYDVVYTAAAAALLVPLALEHPARRSRLIVHLLEARGAIVMLGGMYGGFLIRHAVPLRWADFTPLSASVVGGLLAIGVAAGFYSPPLVGRPVARARPDTHTRAPDRRTARAAGLTGVPRLLWNEYVWTLTVSGSLIVPALFGSYLAFRHSPAPLADLLRSQRLLPFDAAGYPAGTHLYNVIVWIVPLLAVNVARFDRIIRHLKVLPLRSLELTGLLTLWPMVLWGTVWLALLMLHCAVRGWPIASIQAPLFIALVGLSAMIRAAVLFWQAATVWILPLTTAVSIAAFLLFAGASQAALALGGVAALAAAAAAHRRALTRRAVFKNIPLPSGMPAIQ